MTRIIVLVSLGFITLFPAYAQADEKWFYWQWPIGHFKHMKFDQRYLETGKLPHNRQWDKEKWTPAVWVSQSRDEIAAVERFYKAGILVEQTVDDGTPVLHVGLPFRQLSGYDKRRVIELVDSVYGITSFEENATILIHDDVTDNQIGLYTKHGLQIQ